MNFNFHLRTMPHSWHRKSSSRCTISKSDGIILLLQLPGGLWSNPNSLRMASSPTGPRSCVDISTLDLAGSSLFAEHLGPHNPALLCVRPTPLHNILSSCKNYPFSMFWAWFMPICCMACRTKTLSPIHKMLSVWYLFSTYYGRFWSLHRCQS